jgi:hypothetical protein
VACISSSGHRKKIKAQKVQVKNFQKMKMQGASPASSFSENPDKKDTKQPHQTNPPRNLRVKSSIHTRKGVYMQGHHKKSRHSTIFYIQPVV